MYYIKVNTTQWCSERVSNTCST